MRDVHVEQSVAIHVCGVDAHAGFVLPILADIQTTHMEQAEGGTTYMSASDPRIHFGMGKRSKIASLVITWPSGQVNTLTKAPLDQIIAVKDGSGVVPRLFAKVPSR